MSCATKHYVCVLISTCFLLTVSMSLQINQQTSSQSQIHIDTKRIDDAFSKFIQGCSNFDNENACRGQQTDNDASWSLRGFQTPPRGHELWSQGYQDYSILVGYARVVYQSQRRDKATVKVITKLRAGKQGLSLKYYYNDVQGQGDQMDVDGTKGVTGQINIRVEAYEGDTKVATLKLEPVDFIWNHPSIGSQPAGYRNGQRGAIVEMFGWPYADIAQECQMLGKAGYLGVKVFPPQQAILDYTNPENGQLNPWYWLYQPVSYKLTSRMGTAQQLRTMIDTCRRNNVRVYADAVVNHMAGNGNDMFPSHCSGSVYWGPKNSSAGSPFYTQGFAYENWTLTGQRPGMEMPAVPYGPLDFHCARALNSWTDGFILNYGWLVNLADLNTESDYVRQRIADYLTELLSLGFSGVRIDAAKHISPTNLAAIFAKLKSNLGGQLPDDFVAYLQVIIGGEKDLLMCQQNPYNYGTNFQGLMRAAGLSQQEVNMIRIWQSDYPKEFPLCGWPISPERYAIQLDCHDDQFPGSSSRDMGDSGSVLVKEKNVDKHRNFQIQLFTRTDANWTIRLLLSSYTFIQSRGAYSFPDGHSDCTNCQSPQCRQKCTKTMPYSKAHQPDVCGYTCLENGSWRDGVYTRVHRDLKIIRAMRKFMGINQNASASQVGLPSYCS